MKGLLFALLALAALVAGGWAMGWQGVLMVLSVVIFLLLLQFTKLMRTMRRMGSVPLGATASCLMLQSRLAAGMPLLKVLELAGSLGERVGESGASPEQYAWRDAGGDRLLLRFDAKGRLLDWQLERAS